MNDTIYGALIGCGATISGINRANSLTRLTNLLSALSTAKAKKQQTYTKTLLRWLEKTLSKI